MIDRKDYIDRMKSTQKMTEEELKSVSDGYDSIYLHPVRAARLLQVYCLQSVPKCRISLCCIVRVHFLVRFVCFLCCVSVVSSIYVLWWTVCTKYFC